MIYDDSADKAARFIMDCSQNGQPLVFVQDAQGFMEDLAITELAAGKIIRTSYDLTGLISFLTAGEDEVRAWPIPRGTHAPQAAGAIHSVTPPTRPMRSSTISLWASPYLAPVSQTAAVAYKPPWKSSPNLRR